MQPLLHHCAFRQVVLLTVGIVLMATLACGSAAQPDPAPTPEPAASASADSPATSDHGHDSQPAPDAPSQASSDEVVIKLPITDRSTILTRDALRVSRGDTVRLVFEADEEGEIHLHGYDLTAAVSPGHPGELVFEADAAGAFGLNFHVFAVASSEPATDNHGADAPQLVVSETPVSVAITAEPDAQGGVDVQIVAEGFRFAPELVDQPHTTGAGHAHIYVDGVKLGRVFEDQYHIEELAPGEHEIRVSLNTNDHGELTFNGEKVDSTLTLTIPDVGQGHGDSQSGQSHDGHGHSHDTPAQREVIAEVHLGNLEVYP